MARPGRPGVTPEQIVEAARALSENGQNPTNEAVRSYLGGGSPNRISQALREWRRNNPSPVSITPPIPKAVETALLQSWSVIWQAAQSELASERAALHEAAEREQIENRAEIDRLNAELEHARNEVQQANEVLEAERQAHSQARARLQQAQALAGERAERIREERQDRLRVEQQRNDLRAEVATLTERAAHIKTLEEALSRLGKSGEYRQHDTDLEARIAEVVACVRGFAAAGKPIDSITLNWALERAVEAVPSESNEKIWTALCESERPGTAAALAKQSATSDGLVRKYCASLAAAGFVAVADGPRGARHYQLINNTGPYAPRIYKNQVFDPNTHLILTLAGAGEQAMK